MAARTPRAPHVPVLLDRVVELLAAAPDGTVADLTLGAAGHATAVLAARRARHGHAHLVGVDRDPDAHALATARLDDDHGDDPAVTWVLATARFDAAGRVLDDAVAAGAPPLAAALLDLGISSMHVDRPERGFSYRNDGPLDMRMGPDAPRTAADVVNGYPEADLARVLADLGEERHARRVAAAIVRARPLASTIALAEVVREAVPAAARRRGGHPATRTFQAIRIEVNGELDALGRALPQVLDRLVPGGVCVVLSYHSLEDRIVKRAFVAASTVDAPPPGLPVLAADLPEPAFEVLVRRPERPGPDEVAANPRSSAARLRAVRRRTDAPAASDAPDQPRPERR